MTIAEQMSTPLYSCLIGINTPSPILKLSDFKRLFKYRMIFLNQQEDIIQKP